MIFSIKAKSRIWRHKNSYYQWAIETHNSIKIFGYKDWFKSKWDDHINAIIPTISPKIRNLLLLTKIVFIEPLTLVYNHDNAGVQQPQFDYADIVCSK